MRSEWRAGITYTTAPGATHLRPVTTDRLIAEVDPIAADPR